MCEKNNIILQLNQWKLCIGYPQTVHDPSCCWQHKSCYSNILLICLSWSRSILDPVSLPIIPKLRKFSCCMKPLMPTTIHQINFTFKRSLISGRISCSIPRTKYSPFFLLLLLIYFFLKSTVHLEKIRDLSIWRLHSLSSSDFMQLAAFVQLISIKRVLTSLLFYL